VSDVERRVRGRGELGKMGGSIVSFAEFADIAGRAFSARLLRPSAVRTTSVSGLRRGEEGNGHFDKVRLSRNSPAEIMISPTERYR
jgi:hypothetical protein